MSRIYIFFTAVFLDGKIKTWKVGTSEYLSSLTINWNKPLIRHGHVIYTQYAKVSDVQKAFDYLESKEKQ